MLASDRNFDLILCRCHEPQMTGVELHQWLAEHSATLAARVVFVTGGTFGASTANYVRRVGNPTLSKPFGPRRCGGSRPSERWPLGRGGNAPSTGSSGQPWRSAMSGLCLYARGSACWQ